MATRNGAAIADLKRRLNPYTGTDLQKKELAGFLAAQKDIDVMMHFLGRPLHDAPFTLDEAVIVCLNLEWWQKEPHPTTEVGIAELHPMGQFPTTHAENILTQIRVAHARVMEHAHLVNRFKGAGDPEDFHFGISKFVTVQEARLVLVNTFCRLRADRKGQMQPIILLAHDAEGKFTHIKEKLNIDILALNTVVKVIDTQKLAQQAGIMGPVGPTISLAHLVHHFNIQPDNLHTAGNDAGYTMITAILASLKNDLYGQYLPFARAFGPPPPVVKGRHIIEVIDNVMMIGKSTPPPPWGRLYYCTRCGRMNHQRLNCFANVACTICRSSNNPKLVGAYRTHDTEKCLYRFVPLPETDPNYVQPVAQENSHSKETEEVDQGQNMEDMKMKMGIVHEGILIHEEVKDWEQMQVADKVQNWQVEEEDYLRYQ
ncbi:hypothetical protein K458DRAFT_460608 [Lentithecium fluviatile CBS 122367]|uniref:Gfd2/YDR514C-like C-terminal domain-containing protein n=1 Tax=Lentithecium fluviatile CBS 122367 TaxID=1168545 RepID=A0A6G1INE1_9PLEO|nr:hypothetical protein K458DRAFT_460608 [Lentithecium fluviatile CBS 122367]